MSSRVSFGPRLLADAVVAVEVVDHFNTGRVGVILLRRHDDDAAVAAAQVEHPLIVEIYNFVTHEGAGYIVMEYVGGTSLKQLLKQRMEAAGGKYDYIINGNMIAGFALVAFTAPAAAATAAPPATSANRALMAAMLHSAGAAAGSKN